jgi:hypothetical protein
MCLLGPCDLTYIPLLQSRPPEPLAVQLPRARFQLGTTHRCSAPPGSQLARQQTPRLGPTQLADPQAGGCAGAAPPGSQIRTPADAEGRPRAACSPASLPMRRRSPVHRAVPPRERM